MKFTGILKSVAVFLFLSIMLFESCSQTTENDTIYLKGKWRFQIDPEDIGIKQKWYQTILNDFVNLPGSIRDNNKGDEVTITTKWTGSIYDSSWVFSS